jgi:spermidine/putrescine transport system ATP-binding protein
MEMPIISVEHITKSFGDKVVLNDVSLHIKRGEFITILGPSGCGKTTLLRLLAGFERPTQGTVRLQGEDITHVPPYKRPMNTVFQRYALFPHLDVYENIAFGLKLKKIPEKQIGTLVAKALKTVGMTDYEDRDVNSLSGGQQQRVAIARAIVNQPMVLLLDEPLAALDLKMRHDMQMELKEMHKQLGITFIYVTHDQEEALTLSDTIVVMNDGIIQQIGTPMDIYNEPKNPFVADFIGESNIITGHMVQDLEVNFMNRNFQCVDKGFAPGEPVDVVIRPEDIYLLPNPEKGQFRGTVKSCTFKGVHYEMFINTPDGYEIQVQDYNAFAPGTEVGMLIKPADLHVMPMEYIDNTLTVEGIDATHVDLLGSSFEVTPGEHVPQRARKATVHIPFDCIELTDNEEDGTAAGTIHSILWKGHHYHLTIVTESKETLHVETDDVWEQWDVVGINIKPEDILFESPKQEQP